MSSGDKAKANEVSKRSSEGEGLHVKLSQNEKEGDSEGEQMRAEIVTTEERSAFTECSGQDDKKTRIREG